MLLSPLSLHIMGLFSISLLYQWKFIFGGNQFHLILLCRFHTITTAYYRGALGIMMVYDVTKEKTFHNISKWMRKIEENANEDVERILVANKCDLVSQRQITKERGETLAKNHGIRHVETSALSSDNIDHAFTLLTQDILNKVCPPVREENVKNGKGKKKKVNLKGSAGSHHKSCC